MSVQETMRWFCDELRYVASRTRDYSILREFLEWLEGSERFAVLGNLFWVGLETGNFDVADVCIAEGYEIAPTDRADSGPLHLLMSRYGDRPDIADWLIAHGAEVDRRDVAGFGDTPLIAAAFRQLEGTVVRLLERGADVDARRLIDDNETALMGAAVVGNVRVVEMLIAGGADIRLKTRFGQDAAEIAESRGYNEISRLIRRDRTFPAPGRSGR